MSIHRVDPEKIEKKIVRAIRNGAYSDRGYNGGNFYDEPGNFGGAGSDVFVTSLTDKAPDFMLIDLKGWHNDAFVASIEDLAASDAAFPALLEAAESAARAAGYTRIYVLHPPDNKQQFRDHGYVSESENPYEHEVLYKSLTADDAPVGKKKVGKKAAKKVAATDGTNGTKNVRKDDFDEDPTNNPAGSGRTKKTRRTTRRSRRKGTTRRR